MALRRRRALGAVALLALLGLTLWLGWAGRSARAPAAGGEEAGVPRHRDAGTPVHFAVRQLPLTLPFALQDAAAVALPGGRMALLGGLDAADTSTAAVSVLAGTQVVLRAHLPQAQHDAQAALIDGKAYVLGGGQFGSYEHILAFDPLHGTVAQAGRLPRPTSDAAVAAIAGTVYVVGGYDGQQALDTIVAWRPGAHAEVIAHLPFGLRYAAVAAYNGRLLIVGGSRGESASAAILRFDPATGQVQPIGQMPSAVTHAAAVTLGRYVYVLGGRGAAPESQSAAIVSVDPVSGRVARVGRLPQGRSDAAVVVAGDRIWVAGGRSPSATVASILELEPRPG